MSAAGHESPFDAGLQTERTLLAWRRTCLALAAGNAVAIRYLSDALGAWATLLGVVGLAMSATAWVIATVRYRRAHAGLVRDGLLVTDGRLVALVAGSILAACIAGLVLLTTLWRTW